MGAKGAAAASVEQELVFVGNEEGKITAVRQLLQKGLKPPVLIFVQSKSRAKGEGGHGVCRARIV